MKNYWQINIQHKIKTKWYFNVDVDSNALLLGIIVCCPLRN
jgi:hypothetical protein